MSLFTKKIFISGFSKNTIEKFISFIVDNKIKCIEAKLDKLLGIKSEDDILKDELLKKITSIKNQLQKTI
jgi:hypothetical protein